MLYLIGLGLHDWKDMSLRAVDILKKCKRVFFEQYTSSQKIDLKKLEEFIGKKIIVLERKDIESSDILYHNNTALLVIGDPLVATTHYEIIKEAERRGIKTRVIHSSSIISAICETGLHIYKFGKTTSIPFPSEDFKPKSPCEVIKQNLSINAHTLVLLDIGMEFKYALKYLMDCDFLDKNTKAFVCADLGGKSIIIAGTFEELLKKEIKEQPQSLIILAEMHFTEEESFKLHGG